MSACLDESGENDGLIPKHCVTAVRGPVPIVALLFTLTADSPGREV